MTNEIGFDLFSQVNDCTSSLHVSLAPAFLF